jgi:hypothetical protein
MLPTACILYFLYKTIEVRNTRSTYYQRLVMKRDFSHRLTQRSFFMWLIKALALERCILRSVVCRILSNCLRTPKNAKAHQFLSDLVAKDFGLIRLTKDFLPHLFFLQTEEESPTGALGISI